MKWLLIIIAIALIFLISNSGITGYTISESLRIGYCPSMKELAFDLES